MFAVNPFQIINNFISGRLNRSSQTGLLANLILAAAIFIVPDISDSFGEIMFSKTAVSKSYMPLGIMCIVLFIIDWPVLLFKTKMMLTDAPAPKKSAFLYILAFFRILPLVNLYMIGNKIFFGSTDHIPGWMTVVMIIFLTFNFFGIFFIAAYSFKPFKKQPAWYWRLMIELMVWLSMYFMMSSMWGVISQRIEMPSPDHFGKFISEFIAALVLILMIYLPARLPYFMEERLHVTDRKQKIFWYLSIVLVFAAALYSMRWS